VLKLCGILLWGILPLREKINKLAQGNIDDSTPLVFVEPSSIEYELTPNVSVKMELYISSRNDVYVKGLAYSSDMRVNILTPSFGGSNVRLVFEVLLRSTDDDESFSGTLTLVTNGGEFTIPFRFHRKDAAEDHELSRLSTLEDFARLAEEDKTNALRVFDLGSFVKAPFMHDMRYQKLYHEFRKCPDREIALEQFICACGIRINNYSDESIAFSRNKNKRELSNEAFNPHRISAAATFKHHYYEYARLRLAYDMDCGNKDDLLNTMTDHLDAIIDSDTSNAQIILLKAEAEFLKGNIQTTLMLMNSVSSVVRDNRQEMIHEYFLLEYLEIIANHRDKASFIRLCKKFIEEQHFKDLFIYVIRLDDDLVNNDIQLRNFLTEVFSYGVRSPWLYYFYCMLLNDHPEYLYAPKAIDSHSLNFGRKYHIISENITQAVVAASCTAYIKSDKKLVSAHKTYAEGIELDLNINGLYEYYLYTLPNDPDYVINDRVFEHYRLGDKLNLSTKTRLYANVVKNKRKTTSIYKAYEERITEFATEQLKEQNINDYLLDIYGSVLRPEMIDKDLSEQFLRLVNCFRIRTDNHSVRSIIITYPQAANEFVYPASNGNAILPIFFGYEIILFQDAYGNRFYDVPYTKEQLFVQNAYRSAAEKLSPSSTSVRIKKTNELMLKKSITGDDVLHLENEVYEKDLNDDAKAVIINKLIQYYNQHAATGYNPEFLLRINKFALNIDECQDLCNAYIICGCFAQAYDMIKEFGYRDVTDKNLKALCTNLIQQGLYTDETLLINLCEATVKRNIQDNVILDYLCLSYNGPTEIMYDILRKSIALRIDTYDLEERLIAQLIFIGDRNQMDRVFEWYVSRRKASESIVKAYFTIKSTGYVFDDEKIDNKIFEYLENAIKGVADVNAIPMIYILALTKFYSQLENLSKARIDIACKLVYYLLDKKYTLNYLKSFDKYFTLPSDFMSEQILSYRAAPGKMIMYRSCITPTERSFMPETANSCLMNIFIKTKVLFAGETWHYEVYETDGNDSLLIDKGEISFNDINARKQESKFNELNAICSELQNGNDSEIIGMMNSYAAKEAAIRTLFTI